MPSYERWYKLTKYSLNVATAVLGLGIKAVGGRSLAANGTVDALFDLVILIRVVEVIKDTIPLVGVSSCSNSSNIHSCLILPDCVTACFHRCKGEKTLQQSMTAT